VVRAEERGEGGGGVESSFSELPGIGSGSTWADGPFPTCQPTPMQERENVHPCKVARSIRRAKTRSCS